MCEAMTTTAELVVCTTCRLPGRAPTAEGGAGAANEPLRDGERLSRALSAAGIDHRRQECLSACSRGCVVVLRGPQRWTYVQGALDPDHHMSDLLAMIRSYGAAPDGVVPWRQRPEIIRKNTIARIPPMEF